MSAKWILRTGTKPRGFTYLLDGRPVRARERERINQLSIPPAWRDVHIAASQRAPIQAWGYDARGRKQYRYHSNAVQKRELRKHYRVRQLARDLPRLRAILRHDARERGCSRNKVAAGVVRLIAEGFFRVGSERYLRENRTFGITTLRKSHVTAEADHLVFHYRGKGRKQHRHVIVSPELNHFVQEMLATPGARLFRYEEHGKWYDLTADDVNEYLSEMAGFPYTAKDLRTWGGTLRAATVLAELGAPRNDREAKKNAVTAVRLVAAELGNTPAICRKSYVHPDVIGRYIEARETIRVSASRSNNRSTLAQSPEEHALIRFLDRHFPERRRRRRVA
jgi:DNA topoisomerase I